MDKLPPKDVNQEVFWDSKIIKWEQERYDKNFSDASLLEKIASNASRSLRYRSELTEQIIGKNCAGKTVSEIGCGTGRLAIKIINAGAKSYHGYDISSVAINSAKQATKDFGVEDKINFSSASVRSLPKLETDINFSVGLLDWLNDEEIKILLKKTNRSDCLHSFSELRSNFSQILHRLYVQIAYGHRTGKYVPRYFNAEFLCILVKSLTGKAPHVVRDKKLSFGAFISTLP